MFRITGFWQLNNFTANQAKATALQMAERIAYRGPDDFGVWVDQKAGIALAHRRLSILDLTMAGHQPMLSLSGRYAIVFNGEIYNHLEIRKELSQIKTWQGHSDTETLLASFETWGIEETLKKTVGMFAIALWDREKNELTLARDRIGEKPLYFGFQKDTFMFASELKALKAHPDFVGEIDKDVLCLYLRHCYIPAPHSIYKGIQKLLPGTFITFNRETLSSGRCIEPVEMRECSVGAGETKPYWSMSDAVQNGINHPFTGSETEAIAMLEEQLKSSIKLQMISDVPLGAFLSGGVDSSTIVALMQAQSTRPIKTFSIGFNETGYDEAIYAKAVAKHLGTEHTEHYVTSQEAMNVIPKLANMYDEPFADSSQIPTFLVSQMARQHVTVSLSGDAGDELFCGYNKYLLVDKWEKISKIPFAVRQILGRTINTIPTASWDKIFKFINKFKQLPLNMSDKLQKISFRLEHIADIKDLYYSLESELANPSEVVIGGKEPTSWISNIFSSLNLQDSKTHMMYLDGLTYLPNDILAKVDRAGMANSLETRIPLLDHRVVELAWKLPMSMKLRKNQTKWILRQVLYKYVPKELIERPKAGFAIPVGAWLRGPLKDWAEGLLDESRIRQEGYFEANFIRNKWQEHLAGKNNWQSFLWSILMFQTWLENEGTQARSRDYPR